MKMNKQRFMKIMSWYLIISMVFQMLPFSVISAWAESLNTEPFAEVTGGLPETGETETTSGKYQTIGSGEIQGINAYTVIFNMGSGETYELTVQENTKLPSLPEAPLRAGSVFFGWNTAEDAAGQFVTMSTPISSDMELYPIYSRTSAHITYLAGEHGSVNVSEETVSFIDGSGPAGAEAMPDEDAVFLNWTDETGAVVSEEAYFIPTVKVEKTDSVQEPGNPYSGLILEAADAVYTANFMYLPSQNFKGSTDTFTVSVSAPAGTFPEGTEISLSDVSENVAMSIAEMYYGEEVNILDAIAFDLSFYANGEEVQPLNGKKVKVSLNVNYAFGDGDLALLDGRAHV